MDEAGTYKDDKQHSRDALEQKKIEFYRHNILDTDKEELLKVLDSIFLTTGTVVSSFEKKFAGYIGSKYSVGLMSCTHALELALRHFDIVAGDEVITTPLSFVATANAVEYVGAKPVFVDVEPNTGNIDANLIERAITKNTKAIIPVHLYGQMCDMRKIRNISDKYGLKLIEDAAHCVEGERNGVKPGQLGDIACFSFYATKNLTCGEGGAISCNESSIYEWMLKARSHGINKSASDRYTRRYEHYDMEFLGMKSNMSNLSAALMINQIDKLDENLEKRESLAKFYDESFAGSKNIFLLETVPSARHARHLYTVQVANNKRDKILHSLQEFGIGVAVNYRPIHLMSYYRKKYGYREGDFVVAEQLGACTISLPLYPSLKEQERRKVVDAMQKTVD